MNTSPLSPVEALRKLAEEAASFSELVSGIQQSPGMATHVTTCPECRGELMLRIGDFLSEVVSLSLSIGFPADSKQISVETPSEVAPSIVITH